MLQEYWYIFVAAALAVIFFGMKMGGSLAGFLRSRDQSLDPLNCTELKIGQKLEMDGKLDQAAVAYGQVAQKYPGCETGHLFLGYLQRKRGDHAAAAEAFRGALRANPGSVEAMSELAESLWKAGNADGARRVFLQVLEREPANPEAHYALGVMLHGFDPASAMPHLREFLAAAGGRTGRKYAAMIRTARGLLEGGEGDA